MEKLPYKFADGASVNIENNIYLLGSSYDTKKNYKATFKVFEHEPNTLILYQNDKLVTEKIKKLSELYKYVENIKLYDNNGIPTKPVTYVRRWAKL